MSNSSHKFGSYKRRSEVRFFADLDENSNRNDSRRKHLKPYDRSYFPKQRDYVNTRTRFAGDHNSKLRNDMCDQKRCESDDHTDRLSRPTPVVRLIRRSGCWAKAGGGGSEGGIRVCPFEGEDENSGAAFHCHEAGGGQKLRDPNDLSLRRQLLENEDRNTAKGRTTAAVSSLSISRTISCPPALLAEGYIDLDDRRTKEEAESGACHLTADAHTLSKDCNRFDAASISTITSADSSRDESECNISENEFYITSEAAAAMSSAVSPVAPASEPSGSSCNRRRSDSPPDSVFEPSNRKFTSRAYQAHINRRGGGFDSNRTDRSRSFTRSSPIPFRRKSRHISPRLYDFDDYSSPDRDERINRTLYLGHLDPELDEHQIRRLFEPYGEIKSVFVKKVDRTRNTTYGFVKMGNLIQAFHARAALNGQRLGFLKVFIGYGKTYQTSRVWLGNLSPDADSSALYRELDRFGAIVRMVHFKASGEALVEFESISGAVEAKNGMRGVILNRQDSHVPRPSSSSSSSSRPASATSTPSPPPTTAPFPSSASPARNQASESAATTTAVPLVPAQTVASSMIADCSGIVTDFDDHESNNLLESASSTNKYQSTFYLNAPSSTSGCAGGGAPEVEYCVSVTSDSEEDEVHLHHMHDPAMPQVNQNFAQSKQLLGLTVLNDAGGQNQQPYLPPPPLCTSLWMNTISGGEALTDLSPPVTPNHAVSSSFKGPPAIPQSALLFEPEDLMNKSMTRMDPRLLCRSGVYREKSVFDND